MSIHANMPKHTSSADTRTPTYTIYMLLYPSQTPRVSTHTSPLLLHTSPCNIFSLLPRDANAQRPCMLAVVRCLQFCRLEDRALPAVLRPQCCRTGGGKGGGHAGARRRGGERREEGVLRGLAGASPAWHRVHSPGYCASGAILTHEGLPASKLLILNLHPVLRHSLTDSLID